MGQIQNLQTDYLRKGAEQISYKKFKSDGTYVSTVDEDVLFNCPTDIVPLNKDLVRVYDRPLKSVQFLSELRGDFIKNRNGHFLNGSFGYTTNPDFTFANKTGGTTVEFVSDENKTVKALSGDKYFRTDVCASQGGTMTTMFFNDNQYTVFPTDQKMRVAFDYHIKTTSTSAETWFIPVAVLLDITDTSNNTSTARYNFSTKTWISPGNIEQTSNEVKNVNSWGKISLDIEPYSPPGAQTGVIVDFKMKVEIGYPMCKVGTASNFTDLFIDNLRISEVHETEEEIASIRKQHGFNGTFTADYESKDNVLSNEAKDIEFLIGKIDGNYKRPRDTSNKSLEQIITQEIINDHRQFLRRYEGTFRAVSDDKFLALHNKVWVDFGDDVLQEPVTCYIDSMKYDVKASEYDMKMHLPNQDDDVGTTFNVIQK